MNFFLFVCLSDVCVYLHTEQEVRSDHRWSVRTDVDTRSESPLRNLTCDACLKAAAGVLTLADLALLLDVPGVQRRSLLVLHGRAFVEVLGEVGLVESGGLHHLSLREVVLLHVAFHHFCNVPGVASVGQTHHVCVFLPPLYSGVILYV